MTRANGYVQRTCLTPRGLKLSVVSLSELGCKGVAGGVLLMDLERRGLDMASGERGVSTVSA